MRYYSFGFVIAIVASVILIFTGWQWRLLMVAALMFFMGYLLNNSKES